MRISDWSSDVCFPIYDGGLQSSRGLTRRTNKFAGTKHGDAGGGYMKNIVIFADGTGQIGGLRPDQRLSNVYKMYRAMRPGPSSPISYRAQVTYYDPGDRKSAV